MAVLPFSCRVRGRRPWPAEPRLCASQAHSTAWMRSTSDFSSGVEAYFS